VSITSSSGQPGAVPSITVRGVSTINSSTAPLILIDGVSGGDLNLLNPNDVESVSVLKDAASAAIYGARAANGVILITTKQGKRKEKATLTYSGYVGMQTPTALPELVTGRQYMELSNEAMSAAGFSRPYDVDAFEKYDVILTPTSPTVAFDIGSKTNNPLEMYLSDICTVSVNIAGLPGISIPCGIDSQGMPIGLQLIGNKFCEETILNAAYTFEQKIKFRENYKPQFKGGTK
jgi:TonB-dependent SusC/RagA subfamily outer membrane receptor